MGVIIEDPQGDLRRHADQLDARLRDTERLLRAVLLAVCEATGAPVRISTQLLLSADLHVRMDMTGDPSTGDVLYFAYRR